MFQISIGSIIAVVLVAAVAIFATFFIGNVSAWSVRHDLEAKNAELEAENAELDAELDALTDRQEAEIGAWRARADGLRGAERSLRQIVDAQKRELDARAERIEAQRRMIVQYQNITGTAKPDEIIAEVRQQIFAKGLEAVGKHSAEQQANAKAPKKSKRA